MVGLYQRQVHAQVHIMRHPLLCSLGIDRQNAILGLTRQDGAALTHVSQVRAQLGSAQIKRNLVALALGVRLERVLRDEGIRV